MLGVAPVVRKFPRKPLIEETEGYRQSLLEAADELERFNTNAESKPLMAMVRKLRISAGVIQ